MDNFMFTSYQTNTGTFVKVIDITTMQPFNITTPIVSICNTNINVLGLGLTLNFNKNKHAATLKILRNFENVIVQNKNQITSVWNIPKDCDVVVETFQPKQNDYETTCKFPVNLAYCNDTCGCNLTDENGTKINDFGILLPHNILSQNSYIKCVLECDNIGMSLKPTGIDNKLLCSLYVNWKIVNVIVKQPKLIKYTPISLSKDEFEFFQNIPEPIITL